MRLIEAPPAPPRRPGTYQPWHPPAQRRPAVPLVGLLIQAGWRWRVELAAVAIAVTVRGWLAAVTSRPVAVILTVGLLAAVVVPAQARARLGWIEARARLRRRWGRACRHRRAGNLQRAHPKSHPHR